MKDPYRILEIKDARDKKKIVVHLSLSDPLLRFHYLRGILWYISQQTENWDLITLLALLISGYKKTASKRIAIIRLWERTSNDHYNLIRLLPTVESMGSSQRKKLIADTLQSLNKTSSVSFHRLLFDSIVSNLDEKSYKIISYLLSEQSEDIPEIMQLFQLAKTSYYRWRSLYSQIINSYFIPNLWALGLMRITFLMKREAITTELRKDQYWENVTSFIEKNYLQISFWHPLHNLTNFMNWSKIAENDFILELPFGNWTTIDMEKISSYPIPPIQLRYGFDKIGELPNDDEAELVFDILKKHSISLHNLSCFPRKKKTRVLAEVKRKGLVKKSMIFFPPQSLKSTLLYYFLGGKFDPKTNLNPGYFLTKMEEHPYLNKIYKEPKIAVRSFGIYVTNGEAEPLVILRLYNEGIRNSSPHESLMQIGTQRFHSGQTFRFDGSLYNSGYWKGHELTLTRIRNHTKFFVKYKESGNF